MRKAILTVTVAMSIQLLLSFTPVQAQKAVTDGRIAAAQQLLKTSGAAKNFDTVIPIMIRQIRTIFSRQLPKKGLVLDEIFATMEGRMIDRKKSLLDKVAAVYAGEFTTAEMNKLSAFFTSPIGVRFVTAQPRVLTKTTRIGQVWGRQIGLEIAHEVQKELKSRGVRK